MSSSEPMRAPTAANNRANLVVTAVLFARMLFEIEGLPNDPEAGLA